MTAARAVRPSPRALTALRRRDPALARAMKDTRPFPGFPDALYRRHSHAQSLTRSIIYQQVATAAGRAIEARVIALTPGRGLPRPEEILALDDAALRGAGLSAGKLASIRDLAARVTDGRLALGTIGRLDDDAIVERLVSVRGIGVWTAHMFLIFKLGRLDVMPTGDLAVREGMRRLDGLDERPTPDALAERAAAWAPLRSVAAWTLWRLVAP